MTSHFLVNEDGPGDVFRLMRKAAGVDLHEEEMGNGEVVTVYSIDDSFTAKAVSCELCMSVYSSPILALLPDFILLPLGAAGWAVAFFLRLKGNKNA